MSGPRHCIVIPVYNHGEALARVLDGLSPAGLTCFLVDDGSDDATRSLLAGLPGRFPWVVLVTLPRNQGKGAAVKEGLRRAAEAGYTHAVQMDADGQHDPGDVPRFVETSLLHPEALVLGYPLFGPDAPRGRLYGRWVCKLWVWLETLSFSIRDPLVGFRCYPLTPILDLMRSEHLGNRMDFDPEAAVRLSWRGVPIVSIPTRVRYPVGGVSHFRLWADNWDITRMNTRLFFGLLFRGPSLLIRKCRKK